MEAACLAERLPRECWSVLFGNHRPVGLEIGPGRGDFLVSVAGQRPEWNFFAIERSFARTGEIESKLARRQIGNARVVCADASCLLPLLPSASIAAVFIQFPDPWWKRRHEKRRLWTPEFVAVLRDLMLPGAPIEVLTDVAQTFALARATLERDPGLERIDLGRLERHDTSFARKALQRGGVIYRAVYRRIGAPEATRIG
jgi:tRNA (guanine-N7-)-methyltransferase